MNQDFECPPQHQGGPPPDQQKLASERAAAFREEEWLLHNECLNLAREALEHYKTQGEKRLRIPDLARIIDLASRLGRLATGIPTEHIQHAWSEYQNQLWTAQFEADIRKIYGECTKDRSADFSRPVGTVSQASPDLSGQAVGSTPHTPKYSEENLGRNSNSM